MDLLALQNELKRLEGVYSNKMPDTTPIAILTPDLEKSVRAIVKDEMYLLMNNKVPDEPNPMLIAIGSLLTEEQQLFFSDNKNQIKLVDFLKTAEGMLVFKKFLTLFQEFCKRG